MLKTVAPQLVDALRSRLSTSLTVSEAARIADATVARRVPAGADICSAGDQASGLVFLVRGSGEILRGTPNTESPVLATVESPAMLGEVSLMTGQPGSVTVRAQTECRCYVLTRSQFQRLLETDSRATGKLMIAIAEGLARKLSAMNDRVAPRARV